MDFGICVASKIDDIGYIERAEALGYSHAWIADSQMIWSDCYAVLALAAARTSRIRLGTGVAITGTRIAPVTAHSIATINRIAPGRTFLGIGAGNTALRLMGHRPVGVREFGEYLRVVRALLDGEEADFAFRGRTEPLRFLMEEQGFIATRPRIPMYVSGFGPKSQGLAGEVGDGLVMSIPPNAALFDRAIENCRRGAEAVGRDFDRDSFYTCSLTTTVILEPGEDLTSPRVIEECGPFVLSGLHYLYDQQHQFNREPPRLGRVLRPGRADAGAREAPASSRRALHLLSAGRREVRHPGPDPGLVSGRHRRGGARAGPDARRGRARSTHAAAVARHAGAGDRAVPRRGHGPPVTALRPRNDLPVPHPSRQRTRRAAAGAVRDDPPPHHRVRHREQEGLVGPSGPRTIAPCCCWSCPGTPRPRPPPNGGTSAAGSSARRGPCSAKSTSSRNCRPIRPTTRKQRLSSDPAVS
ncbi:MAG: LLM class flavin-dependent oxidoreductase [Acidobacteria bacterium]|nr:LLM class flavin-dependent oxidoreductase [Acidobacteriota bacterium]